MEVTSSGRKHFTQQKKEMIVQEHYSTGVPVTVLARRYGIHAITLYGWKRQMNHKKNQSDIDPAFIQKLVEENDRLKSQNKILLSKIGDLSIRVDILRDAVEIAKKKAILKVLQSPKKSKRIIGMK